MFINSILIKFAKNVKKELSLSTFMQLIITLLSSATAICTSFLITEIIKEGSLFASTVIQFFCGILIMIIVIAALNMAKTKITISAGIKVKDDVRSGITQKLLAMGPAIFPKYRTGSVASMMTSRVEWLMNYYTLYLPVVVAAILNALLFAVVLLSIDWWTGIIAIISCVAMIVIPMFFFKLMKKRGIEEWEMHAKYYSECLDGIQGMISLKSLNADKWYIERLKRNGEGFRKTVMAHLKVTMIEGSLLELFARIGGALTLVVLAMRFSGGYVNEDVLVFTFFAIGAAFLPMLALINAWHMGFQGVSSSYSIESFLEMSSDVILKEEVDLEETLGREALEESLTKKFSYGQNERCNNGCEVRLRNVGFRYDSGATLPTVENINIEIKSGKMLALVGLSGSGKTTIASLLAGFYKPQKGEILIDEMKLNNITKYKSQGKIAAVWQDSHLFTGTVYDNILMGSPCAGEDAVYEAAKRAEIHDFIESLPEKYNTQMGEQGMRFSTGERQRITIARALLKDAQILIFDEATSALDRENEIKIQKSFSELRRGKTVLVIAHRLQTILDADEICVLDKGGIVDRGTHHELIRKSPMYKKVMGAQINA